MKILHTAQQIRDAIKEVLDDENAERHVFVAFVGRDPVQWLPHPKGLRLFCWPRAGGTNPDGIEALVKAGVTVLFTEYLHSKVYHSQQRGTVIGSANLSDNALGSGRLTETAVMLPPGVFSLDEQLKMLPNAVACGTDAFAEMMHTLRREHVAYYQRNPGMGGGTHKRARKKKISFGEWADLHEATRSQWQLGLWSGQYDPPRDLLEEFQEAGGTQFSNWRAHYNPNNIVTGVATLDCRYHARRWGIIRSSAHWWFPEVHRPTRDPLLEENREVWYARVNIPENVSIPFDCSERRFLEALDKAVAEFADETENLEGPVDGDFLKLLLAKYHEAS